LTISYPVLVSKETGPNTEKKIREVIDHLNSLVSLQAELSSKVSGIKSYVPEVANKDLSAGGSNPINVTGLVGSLAQTQSSCIMGTRAQRANTSANNLGSLYYETDTGLTYIAKSVSGVGTWIYASGVYQDTYANRPTVTESDNGLPFYATDQNVLYVVEAGSWIWLAGIMFGTITPDQRPTLAAGDIGFRFFALDATILREQYWTGTVWAYVTPDASTTISGVVNITTQSFSGNKTFLGSIATGALGANGATPQTAYASGGALSSYVTGGFGLDSDAHMKALFDLVVKIRTALVNAGIMS
jgi:hypothetical protein